MEKGSSIMELVSAYDAYVGVEELRLSAASEAPASTVVCAVSWMSSGQCASAAVSFISSVTYEATC